MNSTILIQQLGIGEWAVMRCWQGLMLGVREVVTVCATKAQARHEAAKLTMAS